MPTENQTFTRYHTVIQPHLAWLDTRLQETAAVRAQGALVCATLLFLLSPLVEFYVFFKKLVVPDMKPGDLLLDGGPLILGAFCACFLLTRFLRFRPLAGVTWAQRVGERYPNFPWAMSGVLVWLAIVISPSMAERAEGFELSLVLLTFCSAVLLQLAVGAVARKPVGEPATLFKVGVWLGGSDAMPRDESSD